MHNSYYFILISVVIFSGHITSINTDGPFHESPKFGFVVLAGGLAALGIGAVLISYNQKKINAEDQRQILENMIDKHYTATGFFKTQENDDFNPRKKDNPFAIQSTVTTRTKGPVDRFFIDTVSIETFAYISLGLGFLGILFGLGILLAPVVPCL